MDGYSSQDSYLQENNHGDHTNSASSSSTPSGTAARYRLFGRQRSVHQIMGGGKAADVIMWKQRRLSFGVIVIVTFFYLIVEWSGLSLLSIASDILLALVIIQFLRANGASLLEKQLQPLPELVLSEEMVNDAAASFRVKFNNVLIMAHDITIGKDIKLFFQVAICLWLLSVIASFLSFFTIAYIVGMVVFVHRDISLYHQGSSPEKGGSIVAITIPALYSRYEKHVDKYAGLVHQNISKHYKIVDESVISRLPRSLSKKKDA